MPGSLVVRDVMTADVVTVEPETSLREAAELLASIGASGLPVVAGGRVVGVLSGRDIVDFAATLPGVPSPPDGREPEDWLPPEEAAEEEDAPARFFRELWLDSSSDLVSRFERRDGLEWNVLEEHDVSELMTRALVSVAPDTSIPEAAGQMVRKGVHRLLVVEDDRLVGLITATDLLRTIAQEATAIT